MNEQAPVRVTCVDRRTPEQSEVVKLFLLFVQMTALAGVLVLLFAAQAVITVWSGCATATRSLRATMTRGGRDLRRVLYVFYLGTAASWSSGQGTWNSSPEPDPLRAEASAPSASGPRMKVLECPVGDR